MHLELKITFYSKLWCISLSLKAKITLTIVAVKEKSNLVMKLVTSGIKYCTLGPAQAYFDVGIKFSVMCFSPKKRY